MTVPCFLKKTILLVGLFLGAAGCRSTPGFDFGPYSEAERLYTKGEYEKAIAKYEEHLRENPEGNLAVISHYTIAKCYEALGRKGEARALYRKIVKGHPKLIWADFSRARLGELSETPS